MGFGSTSLTLLRRFFALSFCTLLYKIAIATDLSQVHIHFVIEFSRAPKSYCD